MPRPRSAAAGHVEVVPYPHQNAGKPGELLLSWPPALEGLASTDFALLQLFVSLGASFGPLTVGGSSDALGSLTAAFYVLLVPMVIGCLVVLRARLTYDDDADAALAEARPIGGV